MAQAWTRYNKDHHRSAKRSAPLSVYATEKTYRISGYEFGDGAGNTHASCSGNEPTPNGRGRATSFQWVDERGSDGGEETRDTDGEREGGQIAELALEDLIGCQLGHSRTMYCS